jgi:hypothetical protein
MPSWSATQWNINCWNDDLCESNAGSPPHELPPAFSLIFLFQKRVPQGKSRSTAAIFRASAYFIQTAYPRSVPGAEES